MTVGEKIREARLKKGFTQAELAELLGYKSRSSINKIEVEGRDIPRSSIIKFAKALDVSPAYLMGWEDERRENMTTFLKTVLSLLNQKGVSRNKMLTDLHLGKNSFVNWENRGTIPGGDTLNKIAEYFNVSTDYLLGNEQTPSGNVYDQYSAEDLEIAKLYAALPDDDRRALKEYLKYLADKNKKQN